MPTKLFLRNTKNNGVTDSGDTTLYDMIITAGATTALLVRNTTSGGLNLQWTDVGGGSTVAWISGRVPTGGFTLTTTDMNVWAKESNMSANASARVRIYKYNSGVVTELGGSPFDDGVEFSTTMAEMAWVGNVTDTALVEDERLLVRFFATSGGGAMGDGFNCTLSFNGADAAAGDSFFNIAEAVTFKAEDTAAITSTIKMMPMRVQFAW